MPLNYVDCIRIVVFLHCTMLYNTAFLVLGLIFRDNTVVCF